MEIVDRLLLTRPGVRIMEMNGRRCEGHISVQKHVATLPPKRSRK
jgi:hypothetical protein